MVEKFVVVTSNGHNYGDFKSSEQALSWAEKHILGVFQIAPVRRRKDFDYDKPRDKLYFVA